MHAEHTSSELKRSLNSLNLISLGIGCIIGTGIFVLTGRAAADFAGPAIMISFIITGVLCTFVALCYSELASMLPVSGSAYSYSYASMGELVAWFMGLLLVLEYGLAAATVAVGWSSYAVSLLPEVRKLDDSRVVLLNSGRFDKFAGPVGIVHQFKVVIERGELSMLVYWLALISINLGLFNLFLFGTGDIIHAIGVVCHEQRGSDAEKLAFLRS